MILSLGLLWSTILVIDLKKYLPFFSLGYVIWIWISNLIIESTQGFIQYENIIKQTNLPFPIYIFRICVKNFIILIHNGIIIFGVLIYQNNQLNLNYLYVIPSIILVQLVLTLLCINIAIFCTRFRDMTQVVAVIVQIIFFFTPIIWNSDSLKNHQYLIQFNPVFHWINIIREPLLGNNISEYSIYFVLINLFILFIITFVCLGKYKNKISIWL
jgi:lipopolysaccharide transport system permease protein